MVGQAALYAQNRAKSFKEQAGLVAAYQQGFRDYKTRIEPMIGELWTAMLDYEKTRTSFIGRFPGLMGLKEKKLERAALKLKAEFESEI